MSTHRAARMIAISQTAMQESDGLIRQSLRLLRVCAYPDPRSGAGQGRVAAPPPARREG